jgi:hypothetical protein
MLFYILKILKDIPIIIKVLNIGKNVRTILNKIFKKILGVLNLKAGTYIVRKFLKL